MKENGEEATWVENLITTFVRESPDNSLADEESERAWGSPIIGFSRGADPLYVRFKEHIGAYHWTPAEIFELTFPDTRADADDLTVISWVLPQTEATKVDNRKQTVYPSERWARSRIYGEAFNVKLRRYIEASLQEEGHKSVSPMLSDLWKEKTSDRFGFASTWSERHAAFASGLGTFGLCDGLITPLGKAVRIGSVIAQISMPPTVRSYTDHQAYCLFFSRGICGRCIDRCPVRALSIDGHDKETCGKHTLSAAEQYVRSRYGFHGYGCGLCQTGVPCESGIPQSDNDVDL